MKRLTQEQSYFIVKDNQLITKSRYSLSLTQQKILLYLISRIKPFDKQDTIYELSIKDFVKVCGYDNKTYYPLIKKDIKELADASSWIETTKGEEILFRWIDEAKIIKGIGIIQITFHKSVSQYLFDLKKKYTQYSLFNVLCLSHKYSIRLYEYLCSMKYKNEFEISIDELRKRLDAENNSYNSFSNFKMRILDPAIKDIDNHTDLLVSYSLKKTGNRTTHISFKYYEKETNRQLTTMYLQQIKIDPQKRKATKKVIKEIKESIDKTK